MADVDLAKQNVLLESTDRKLTGDTAHRKAEPSKVEDYRRHCITQFGSDVLPPVLYKGHTIKAGRFGERELPA